MEAAVAGIIEKIKEDTEKEVKAVLEEARSKADGIIKEAQSRAKGEEEEILRRGAREAELVKQRIIADAKLKARKQKLNVKEAAIQAAFGEAEKELRKFGSTAEYPSVLKKIIKEAVNSIGSEDMEIITNKADRKIVTQDFLKSLSKFNIALSPQTIETSGGVIVRAKNTEVDNTFETRMARMRDNLRTKVAKILFEGV